MMSPASRALAAFSALALALLITGCDGVGNETSAPSLEGQYDLQGVLTITAGEFRYDGQLTLQRDNGSFSGQGQLTVIDANVGDTVGTREIEEVIGGTYNHPSVTMLWDMNNPAGAGPDDRDNTWAFDGTVSADADTIQGLVEVGGVRNGSITLIRQ